MEAHSSEYLIEYIFNDTYIFTITDLKNILRQFLKRKTVLDKFFGLTPKFEDCPQTWKSCVT